MSGASHYNIFLVLLSYFIAVFGSFTALQLASLIRDGSNRLAWLLASALCLGGGAIWSMHFIAMLAFHPGMEVGYDVAITFLSLLIAVAVVAVGLWIVSSGQSLVRLVGAGVITGLGVSAMHYSGMAAMVMAADVVYDPVLLVLSIIIGIVAAIAALWLAFNLTGKLQRFGSAFIMGMAVSGMHYTGMAAMTMVPNEQAVDLSGSMAPMTLGLLIFCFTMLVLVMCLLVALIRINQSRYETAGPATDMGKTSASA